MALRSLFLPMGAAVAIAIPLITSPTQAQDNYICYLESDDGQVFNLETLCGTNTITSEAPSSTTARREAPDYSTLLAAFGIDQADVNAYAQAYSYTLATAPNQAAVANAIASGDLNPVEDGLDYCAGLAAGQPANPLLISRVAATAQNGLAGLNQDAAIDTAATHYSLVGNLAPTYFCAR
ncbi:MAG TPA: hypothetical protein V6D07_15675 [Trichocoleus sp.]